MLYVAIFDTISTLHQKLSSMYLVSISQQLQSA